MGLSVGKPEEPLSAAEMSAARAAAYPIPVDEHGQPWYISVIAERDAEILMLRDEIKRLGVRRRRRKLL